MISNKIKLLTIVACVMLSALSASAQVDAELFALIDIVKTLRVQSEKNYNDAGALLGADKLWTAMNETGPVQDKECRPADKVPGFKLNSLLAKTEKSRMRVTSHGDMLNGEDERYNYSLFERSIKAGSSVEYKLKGREGNQTFVIVPFCEKGSGISASLKLSVQANCSISTDEFGVLYLNCESNVLKQDDEITLVVKNSSSSNQSFVIINHNTRKKE